MLNSTLCYLEKDGCYLMLHRVKKEKDINKDKWIGVGGKIENAESPEDCIKREVYEETGLTLTNWRYRGLVTFVSNEAETEYMHLFTSDGFVGELTSCNEGILEWVPIDQISSLNLWPGDKIFFRLLREDVPFFSLKLTYQGPSLESVELDGLPLPRERWKADVI